MKLTDRDQWFELLQVVLRNPVRAFLSGLGVSWGIFMLIITLGSTRGLENGMRADMPNRAENSMFLWTMSTSVPYKGYKRGRRLQLRNDDVDFLKEQVPSIASVSPRIQLGGWRGANNVTRGVNAGAFNVYGDTPEYIKIEPIDLYNGRYLNWGDLDQFRRVCVVGDRVREVLFPDGDDPVGQYVRISGINFLVVGVYRSYRSGEDADEATQSIFVPLTTFQKAFNYDDYIGWLSILIKPDVSANTASEDVVAALKIRKQVHPDDPRAFGFWTMAEEYEKMNEVFTGFNLVAVIFGSLVLLSGIIGIVNIMLITVRERTKEIGIRRSIGATPSMVIRQIMGETVFLTSVAGMVGMIGGVVALEAVSSMLEASADSGSFREPGIALGTVLKALLLMVVMGAVAGILPATRAVSIQPVDALRAE
jgi:putative ABC transport system permease protein